MVQTNGSSSSSVDKASSSFLKLDTVPCVLDNKPWEGLSKTYDLKDPHSEEGKVLVSRALLSLFPYSSLCLSSYATAGQRAPLCVVFFHKMVAAASQSACLRDHCISTHTPSLSRRGKTTIAERNSVADIFPTPIIPTRTFYNTTNDALF